jgi:hypothetical protein
MRREVVDDDRGPGERGRQPVELGQPVGVRQRADDQPLGGSHLVDLHDRMAVREVRPPRLKQAEPERLHALALQLGHARRHAGIGVVEEGLRGHLPGARLEEVGQVRGVEPEVARVPDEHHPGHALLTCVREELARREALGEHVRLAGTRAQRVASAVRAPEVTVGIDVAEVLGPSGSLGGERGRRGGDSEERAPAHAGR